MTIVDSSGWIEYFRKGPNADLFAAPIENPSELLVLVITVYEVFKKLHSELSEDHALRAVAHMSQGRLIPIDFDISILGAKVSCDLKIPMADSLILATGRRFHALVWTQDAHFEGLDGAKYIPKRD